MGHTTTTAGGAAVVAFMSDAAVRYLAYHTTNDDVWDMDVCDNSLRSVGGS